MKLQLITPTYVLTSASWMPNLGWPDLMEYATILSGDAPCEIVPWVPALAKKSALTKYARDKPTRGFALTLDYMRSCTLRSCKLHFKQRHSQSCMHNAETSVASYSTCRVVRISPCCTSIIGLMCLDKRANWRSSVLQDGFSGWHAEHEAYQYENLLLTRHVFLIFPYITLLSKASTYSELGNKLLSLAVRLLQRLLDNCFIRAWLDSTYIAKPVIPRDDLRNFYNDLQVLFVYSLSCQMFWSEEHEPFGFAPLYRQC